MKTFGKYRLIEEIGTGPTGTTYRARDTFRDSELSLKILCTTTIDPLAKKQFCRQLAACAELQHSHIAKVLDLGEVDGEIYIATELLNGPDLCQLRQEGTSLPIAHRLRLVAQICDGLAFAHRNHIVHGNITPGNILITSDNQAKILDFGVASLPASCTPNYLSPEQILDRPFDSRSDLFSVGVLLYELITGIYPFQSPAGLIPRQIVHAEPEPLRNLDPRFPEALERLLIRALDKEPERRLQSADEFAVILNSIVRQIQSEQALPVVAPQAGLPEPEQSTAAQPLYASTAAAGAMGHAAHLGAMPIQSAEAGRSMARPSSAPSAAPLPNPPLKTEYEFASTPVPSRKRPVVFLAAAILGISILGALLSRQSTKASPVKIPNQVSQSATPLPASTQPEAKPAPEVQKIEAAVTTPEPQPQLRPEQILNGPVASLWEAGRYAQALRLVNGILADDPSRAEALAWKARIRAAQDAEAGIK